MSYCSRECQKGHWKVHKCECKELKAMKGKDPLLGMGRTDTIHG